MKAHSSKTRILNKANLSLDSLLDSMRRFAQRCREADAMIRRL